MVISHDKCDCVLVEIAVDDFISFANKKVQQKDIQTNGQVFVVGIHRTILVAIFDFCYNLRFGA